MAPGMQWDGTLYEPVKPGGGLQPGTVGWAQVQRRTRADAARVRRIMAEREAEKRRPVKWYLRSWPFVVCKLVARWIEKR